MRAGIKPKLRAKRITWAGIKPHLGGKRDHMGGNNIPSMWEQGPHGLE